MPSRTRARRPADGRTASALVLRPMLSCARSYGVNVEALLAELGLKAEALEDADYRIPEAVRLRAWQVVTRRVGDPAFGLQVAEHAQTGAYDVLDYALYFSSSVRDALDRLIRFRRVLSDSAEMEVLIRQGEAHLRRVHLSTPPEEQDLVFAWLCLRLRQLSGRELRPREVRFQHPAPPDPTPWRELFRSKLRFGWSYSELILDARDLDLPSRTSEPGLVRVLDRHARDLLARLPASADFADRVRRAIAKALCGGPPTLEATAKALHASPRTVQRRLLAEGTTHRELLDEVRRDLAARYLDTPGLSITEIAFLLGFSEASGFRRTYKRWTGQSPSRARAG